MMKFLSSFLGSKSPAFIWFVTQTQGRPVGSDAAGNRYFTGKARKGYKYERRWVLYATGTDSSVVPPEWHGWLHHQTDTIPDAQATSYRKPWQRDHRPNMTGTSAAIYPKGSFKSGGVRQKASADYEAWTPDSHTKEKAS